MFMYLKKGKQGLLVLVLLFCNFIFMHAQELPLVPVSKQKVLLNTTYTSIPIYKINPSIDSLIGRKSDQDLIAAVYHTDWNTKLFNCYKKTSEAVFPITLDFQDSTFAAPVSHKMVITSRYGWRRGRGHCGIDVDLQTGDEVRTLLAGKVRFAKYRRGHGNTVVVRHANGLETVYAHLTEFLVQENEEVAKGQVIGTGGVTGNARGSHLHLEVRYKGESIHPEYLFAFDSTNAIRAPHTVVTKKWSTPSLHKSRKKSSIVLATEKDVVERETPQQIYVVKKGDTLYDIAHRYDLEVSEICKKNALKHNAILNIGQKIMLN